MTALDMAPRQWYTSSSSLLDHNTEPHHVSSVHWLSLAVNLLELWVWEPAEGQWDMARCLMSDNNHKQG